MLTRAKLGAYELLVNRVPEIQKRYQSYRAVSNDRARSWLYLMKLNFCHYVLGAGKKDSIEGGPKRLYIQESRLAYRREAWKLAETIAKTRIAHMGWPELRIDAATSDAIMEILKDNRTLTVFDSAPKELFRLAQRNRDELLAMFIHPELITEEDEAYAREYSDSINMAFGLEKKKLYEMEKTFLAVIARFKGGDEPDGGNKPDGDKPDDDD